MDHNFSDGTSKGLITLVITLLATKVISFFNLGSSYYGLVYSALQEGLEIVKQMDYSRLLEIIYQANYLTLIYLSSAAVATIGCYRGIVFLRNRHAQQEEEDRSNMTVYNPTIVKDISEYIRLSPDSFSNINRLKIGDPKLISQIALNSSLSNNYEYNTNAYARAPQENHPIGIDDDRFKAFGVLHWRIHTEKVTKKGPGDNSTEENFNLRYVEISLLPKSEISVEGYVDKLRKWIEESRSKSVTQYHVKILTDNNSYDTSNDLQILYSGPPPNLVQRESQFIETFFHPMKYTLWEMIKRIEFDPNFFHSHGQAPRIGLLLHGPPGTGKSTFAYRVAMALNRHIVSVDIRSVKYKSRLWQIIKRPRVQTTMTSRDVVFIFDEFDLTVRDLYYREKFNSNMITNWIGKMDARLEKEKARSVDDSGSEDDEKVEQVKPKTNPRIFPNKKKQKDVSYPSLNINHEEIQLSDLLEVFQGPVPIDGLVAIATTNHFDEIQNMCPALFRPGRLTPVHFDYATRDTINEISEYYYQRIPEPDTIPPITSVPTSKLIELVMESRIHSPNDFEYFTRELDKCFD